jgi:hypothetical protein
MAFGKDHELHTRRAGRNFGVAGLLVGFAAIVFGLTVAKVTEDGPIEGFDHVARPHLVEKAE